VHAILLHSAVTRWPDYSNGRATLVVFFQAVDLDQRISENTEKTRCFEPDNPLPRCPKTEGTAVRKKTTAGAQRQITLFHRVSEAPSLPLPGMEIASNQEGGF
jgi:hypothetical protein